MTNYKVENVDEFIAASPKHTQPHLKKLRQLVKSSLEGVEEKIGWGKPFYKYYGWIAGFDVYKNHIGFEIIFGRLPEDLKEMLEKKGYKTGNKSLQIRYEQEIPVLLIKQLLKTKALENKEKVKAKNK